MGLFGPNWKTKDLKDIDSVIQNIKKINNQNDLKEIAVNASLSKIQESAVDMITDENILKKIIYIYKSEKIGFVNINKLSIAIYTAVKILNKDELLDFVISIPDVACLNTYLIFNRIVQNEDLDFIAKNAINSECKKYAVEKIENSKKELWIKHIIEQSKKLNENSRLKLVCKNCGKDVLYHTYTTYDEYNFEVHGVFKCKCENTQFDIVITDEKFSKDGYTEMCLACLKPKKDCKCKEEFPSVFVPLKTEK